MAIPNTTSLDHGTCGFHDKSDTIQSPFPVESVTIHRPDQLTTNPKCLKHICEVKVWILVVIPTEIKGSGQIIVTSRDRFPPNGGFSKGNALISEKSRLVKYYNLARKDDFIHAQINKNSQCILSLSL